MPDGIIGQNAIFSGLLNAELLLRIWNIYDQIDMILEAKERESYRRKFHNE